MKYFKHRTKSKRKLKTPQNRQKLAFYSINSSPNKNFNLEISYQKVAKFLTLVVIGLIIASMVGQVAKFYFGHGQLKGFVQLFFVDGEKNVPATYSYLALLLCSILLAVIARFKSQESDRYVRQWKFLSVIFLYLSFDEAFLIHEQAAEPLRSALNASGILYFTWVVPGAAFVTIFLLAYWQFIKDLPSKTKYLFLIAGTIFVGGALGTELIGGWWTDNYGRDNIVYVTIATIEEALEMLGIVVFIYALLDYLASHLDLIQIKLKK